MSWGEFLMQQIWCDSGESWCSVSRSGNYQSQPDYVQAIFPERECCVRLGMFDNRVSVLGSQASIADDIMELLQVKYLTNSPAIPVLRATVNDLLSMQKLVEAVSKYSCGEVGEEALMIAFNKYRSNLHLAKIE